MILFVATNVSPAGRCPLEIMSVGKTATIQTEEWSGNSTLIL